MFGIQTKLTKQWDENRVKTGGEIRGEGHQDSRWEATTEKKQKRQGEKKKGQESKEKSKEK